MISRRPRRWFAAATVCVLALAPANARAGVITTFAPTSSGPIAFAVADVSDPALVANQAYSFNLTLAVGALPATIALTAPRVVGTSANTVPYGAYHATCSLGTNNLTVGSFVSSGNVALAMGSVTCATLAPLTTGTITFIVTLTLDTGTGPNAFAADTYTNPSPLLVTVNAP